MNERRNDIGFKVGISIICAAMGIILGLFFHSVFAVSCKGVDLALAATMVNTQQTEQIANMDKKLDRILNIMEKGK